MASLHFILRQLEPFVVGSAIGVGCDICPDNIELLCDQPALLADRLYLGVCGDGGLFSQITAAPGAVVLLADASAADPPETPPPGCTLVRFSCSLPKLYNTVAAITAHIAAWRRAFLALTDQGGGLHAIVSLTAQLANASALLLDQAGHVVAVGNLEGSTYLAGQVSATGALPQPMIELIFSACASNGLGCYPLPNLGTALYGCRMAHQGAPIGTLLIEHRGNQRELDLQSLCSCAADCLCRRLLSPDPNRLGSSTKAFQRCWADIVARRLSGSLETRAALSQMPYPAKQFIRVMVITFSEGRAGRPYNYLLAQLRELFPGTNMAAFEKDIVVLLSYETRTFCQSLPERERLTAILSEYDGFAAISNGTRNFDALCSMFLLAKRTALLAPALRKRGDERLFFHEDYSMYCIIDLCVQRYLEIEGNDDILYLIHPAVIHLTRYDRQHNNNLRDVLYYYLLNDRNLVKTAAATYMHRNTVINKVNKIMELLDVDLEDGNLRQRIMFSCQVIRYYESVMNRELKL